MVAANHLHYRGHLPVDPHPDDHATPPLTLTFLSALLPALALAQTVTLQFSGTANFVGAPLTGYFSVTTPSTFTLSSDPGAVGFCSGDTSRTFAALSASLTVQATGGTRTSAG
jgi:hypothetical protein